jgi:hypothetical protein
MLRLEARAHAPRALLLGAPLLAIVFTLAVSSLLVAWAGAPVGQAYALLLEGGFGSRFALSETLTRAIAAHASPAWRRPWPSGRACSTSAPKGSSTWARWPPLPWVGCMAAAGFDAAQSGCCCP